MEKSREFEERLRNFKAEQAPKMETSDIGPDKEFSARSMVVRRGLHLDLEGKEMEPEREVNFRVRDSRESSVIKKVETRVRLVFKAVPLRSMEETPVCLQEIPLKVHGFWLGSQVGRRVGFGREYLKLRSFWVSL